MVTGIDTIDAQLTKPAFQDYLFKLTKKYSAKEIKRFHQHNLLNSFPSDRLSKAFTHLGRIIKTQYILRYLTDPQLCRTVQRQLNKGEYRHKLPRWIFFANQGELQRVIMRRL